MANRIWPKAGKLVPCASWPPPLRARWRCARRCSDWAGRRRLHTGLRVRLILKSSWTTVSIILLLSSLVKRLIVHLKPGRDGELETEYYCVLVCFCGLRYKVCKILWTWESDLRPLVNTPTYLMNVFKFSNTNCRRASGCPHATCSEESQDPTATGTQWRLVGKVSLKPRNQLTLAIHRSSSLRMLNPVIF